MNRTASVVPFSGRSGMQALIAAMLGISAASKIDQHDPKVMKAYGKISSIEPSVAYLAKHRAKRITSVDDVNQLLGDIRDNKVTARERMGLANIYNAHKRVGSFFAKGLEGITDGNYGPAIALQVVTGEEARTEAQWAKDPQVMKAFAGLQNVVVKYFDSQPKAELNA